MELAQYIIPAVAGLISGTIGSLIAPWVHWGIEARREQHKTRQQLLKAAREVLSKPPSAKEFRKLPLHFQLKPLLSSATVKAIEGTFDEKGNETILIMAGSYGGVNPYIHQVLNDL